MTMKSWAEREVEIACKRENPEWDGKSFDYGCSCYQSALKAYKSLMDDGHSGASFSFTVGILERLMKNLPLTPIIDSDFDVAESMESEDELKERGLKSKKQCPRMSSLFRYENLDGTVRYVDIDRVQCTCPNVDGFFSNSVVTNFVNDVMFPITMPYWPKSPFTVTVERFLSSADHEGYDTVGLIDVTTPDGKKIELGRYFTECGMEFVEISKVRYDYLKEKSKTVGENNRREKSTIVASQLLEEND